MRKSDLDERQTKFLKVLEYKLDNIFPNYELTVERYHIVLVRSGLELNWAKLENPRSDEIIGITVLQELRKSKQRNYPESIQTKYPEISKELQRAIAYSERYISRFWRVLSYETARKYLDFGTR